MRSILFSLTLVFFTGCLTEATPTDQVDNPEAIAGNDNLDSTDDLSASFDPAEALTIHHHVDQPPIAEPWSPPLEHVTATAIQSAPRREELPPRDCEIVVGQTLDPRCRGMWHTSQR